MFNQRKKISFAALAALAVGGAISAQAISISYDLNQEYSGGTPPAGSPPWVRLTLDDSPGGGALKLTVNNLGLTDREILSQLDLSYDPSKDVDDLAFSGLTYNPAGAAGLPGIDTGANAFTGVGGGGRYDIEFDFPPPGSVFGAGESFSVIITDTGDSVLNIADFAFRSVPPGGNAPQGPSAHIQRIGAAGGSGWISGGPGTTPFDEEPPITVPDSGSTLALIGAGILGLGLLGRRLAV